ncbi:Gfo/Idh/MocA family protein [Paenactinomyces guangxiensis]|uniref:Gfo/Idh/MocA family oxidoreductase n=1 Tax=Paenactinomyces guangxiensis TaxID=1490290 RepID=A0A7W1WPF4_9BACL|nr:Gfo/Idh/MocA family oxidoreductase [Paenactinomyces guangxiensis]MBA4493484.1 Gfo/Idh/MocA family oxidoreductase [Paenactinomyces guangxiensis]MBH8590575.1 Gfo/Idh/MocA family oxidoreductase [Paenactinomyces guangxiensis]
MINIAIVGTGAIARSHIEGYLAFPERCKIVALVDIYPQKAAETGKKFKLNAEIFSDYRDLLDRPDIHAVSICTPPYVHAPISIDFLKAGKHVLVEKPMASSLKECDEMLEAAATSNKLLSVVAQNRFRTPVMKLKHVLDTGLIGKIAHAQVDSFWWRGYSYYDLWWRGTWEKEGGGCTLNHAVHHIDMLQWMMGMPSEVSAMMSNTLHDNAEVEDLSIAIFRYENGSLSQITSSVVHHGENQQLIFQGEKARVSVPWKVKSSKSKENGFPLENPELEREIQTIYDQFPEVVYEGHQGQIDDFLTAVKRGTSLLIDGVQGRRTLELITAIYKSASLGQTVKLPLAKDDPFYTREGILANVQHFYEKKNSIENFKDNVITTGGKYE